MSRSRGGVDRGGDRGASAERKGSYEDEREMSEDKASSNYRRNQANPEVADRNQEKDNVEADRDNGQAENGENAR